PLLHLRQPRHLAGAVQHEAARQHPVIEDVLARDDGGDAGAHRALADLQRPFAEDDGAVADAHAADVGDRVVVSHREVPDGEPQLAEARSHSGWGDDTSSPGVVVGPGVLSPPAVLLPLLAPLPFAPLLAAFCSGALASPLASLFASLLASRRFSRRRLRPPSRISPISVLYSMPAACAIRHRSE